MVYLGIIIAILILDLGTKSYVKKNYPLFTEKAILKNKLYIKHIKNYGMAFGVLKEKTKQFLKFNCIIISALIGIFLYLIKFKNSDRLLKLIISFIIGGALGNIIDRVKNGCVTDFIYFKIKKAPVFNIADLFLIASFFLSIIRAFLLKDNN